MKTLMRATTSLILFLGPVAAVHQEASAVSTAQVEGFNDGVADLLGEQGFDIDTMEAYTTDPILPGETVYAAISVAGEMDAYTFSASAGDAVKILMGEESGSHYLFNPNIELFDPEGVLVKSASGSAAAWIIGQVLEKTGTYTVVASDRSGVYTGTYGLSLIKMPGSPSSEQDPDGGEIASGETKTGTITVGDLDAVTFSAIAGEVVRILMGEGEESDYLFQPEIELFDPDGVLVVSAWGSAAASVVGQVLDKTGMYTVVASDRSGHYTGTYGLSLVKMPGDISTEPDPDGGEIMSGETKTGTIDVGDLDPYTFSASAGDAVKILMGEESGSHYLFNPNIELFDPEGVLVKSASGSAAAWIIGQVLEKTGTYTVVASDRSGVYTGTYGLSLIKMPGSPSSEQDPDGGEIASGETKTGTIDVGDLDACTFSAIAGEVVKILMGQESGSFWFEPEIELFEPEGVLVKSAWGDAAASITGEVLQKTGTYTVVASDHSGHYTGTYGLSLVKTLEFAAYIASPVRSGSILAGDTLRLAAASTKLVELASVAYQWDFGDGRSSTLKDPGLVTFATPGDRIVALSVTVGQTQYSPTTRTFSVVDDTGSAPDLAATQLNVLANLSINQPAQVSYTAQNIGNEVISGKSWKDSLYLSRDQYLDVNDLRLASVPVSENVSVGGTYTKSVTATIPAVVEGAYYLLLSVDDEWQVLERHQLNNEFAFATDLVIPRLADGVSTPGMFTTHGDARYYRIDVPSGQSLLVRLDDLDDQGANEIYVRFGSLPTRGAYDYRANVPGKADQQLLVPVATSGTWYVMVYGAYVPGDGDFILEATFSELKVTGVVPNSNPSTTEAVLTISGAGFYGTMTVELVASDSTAYPADTVEVDSFTQITSTFAPGTVPAGVYSVQVSRGGDSDELSNAFEVLPAGEAKLETDLIVPSSLGYHAPATIYVEYRNAGNASMLAPLLVLTATQKGKEGAFLTLEAGRVVQGFWTSAMPEGFSHSVQILASGEDAGMLRPGESARVPVYYIGWEQPWDFTYSLIYFNLGVLRTDDTTPVNWNDLKSEMQPSSISAEAWDAVWASFVSQVGSTWGEYLKMLDDNASYLGRLGQRVVDVGQLLAFEFLQADGLSPLRSLASAVDSSVQAPGLPLVFTRSFPQPISQRYELGPFGRGWTHNWRFSLHKASDGKVTITGPGGSRRVFQPDGRRPGSYFPQPGDHATLTALAGGVFTLREPSGLLHAFSSDGKLDYVQDPKGNGITASYSSSLLTSLNHTSGQWLKITYNASGRIQAITDHLGRQTQFSYDAASEHLTGAQYYDGRTATYAYNAGQALGLFHALTEEANSCCSHRYFTYDAQGRLTGTHLDGNAEAVAFAYDAAGKVTATDALGHSARFYFDHRGLLVKTENALGNTVHLAFDDQFKSATVTDPAGRSRTYGYDSHGNLARETDELGHTTRYTYAGDSGRLVAILDANGNLTRYTYEPNGALTSIINAANLAESWTYDSQGNRLSWRNRCGDTITYTNDNLGRVTARLYPDGILHTFAYDVRGNLTKCTDATGTTTQEFDEQDRLIQITYPGGYWLRYTYDTAGRRATMLDHLGHRIDYHYGTGGRLQSLTDETLQEIVSFDYDPVGRMSRKTLSNGVYTTYAYDAAGQLLDLFNHQPDGSVLSRFKYSYDSRGRRTTMTTSYGAGDPRTTLAGLWRYDYDDTDQLVGWTAPNGRHMDYHYDGLGNRTLVFDDGTSIDYSVNNLNQYTRAGDTTYEYDADGNLTNKVTPQGTTAFEWTADNKLSRVTGPGVNCQNLYDAMGNRTRVDDGSLAKYLVIDPVDLGDVVGEYVQTGLVARNLHASGLLSRESAAGGRAFYTFDALGSTSEMTGDSASILNAYGYLPFGEAEYAVSALANPFAFAGEYGVLTDNGNLALMRSRFYDSSVGRFLGFDSWGLAGGDVNLLRYVNNDPINSMDPMGTFGWGRCCGWDADHDCYKFSPEETAKLDCYQAACVRHDKACHKLQERWYGVSVCVVTWFLNPLLLPAHRQLFWDWAKCRLNRDDPPPPQPTPPEPPTHPGPGVPGIPVWPRDPNQKIGPAGFGTGGFIVPTRALPYRIDLENKLSVTAPAQQVVTTDQLSANLDWSTFQLTEIGFGDQLIVVPPNTQQYETIVPVSYLDTDFEVQVEAGIRLADGEVYAIFRSIDPATSLPPPVDIGFLPPEDGTGRGQGHISYVIGPKAGLPTGTEIRNVADISFDYQPAIATNLKDPHDPTQGTDPAKECLNTIDADPPTSAVAALPASSSSQFRVCWSGEDIGAGVASYDIYASDDGGDWTLWLAGTTETSARYEGQVGHTYAFYSIARDNVGHIESPPPQADTMTTTTVRFHVISVLYEQGAKLTWASSPGETYTVQSRTDLLSGAWNVEATVPSQGGSTTWTDPDISSARKFYRIGIE